MVNLELTGRSWPAEPTGNPLWPVRGEVITNAEYRSEIDAWVFLYPEGAEGEQGKDYIEWFATRTGPFASREVVVPEEPEEPPAIEPEVVPEEPVDPVEEPPVEDVSAANEDEETSNE